MSSAAAERILVVDDDAQIRKFLRITLQAHGYTVLEASDAASAFERIGSDTPDVVILDLGLPDLDGRQVIRRVREWSEVPILVLSVRGEEEEKVGALDDGANDYVTKPAGIAELLARLRVLLRLRADQSEPCTVCRVGDLEIDFSLRRVRLAGRDVQLSRKEYSLLSLLAQNAGRVLTHQQLMRHLWGASAVRETHNLRVLVSSLRQKLSGGAPQSRYVVTEQGVGYRLRTD